MCTISLMAGAALRWALALRTTAATAGRLPASRGRLSAPPPPPRRSPMAVGPAPPPPLDAAAQPAAGEEGRGRQSGTLAGSRAEKDGPGAGGEETGRGAAPAPTPVLLPLAVPRPRETRVGPGRRGGGADVARGVPALRPESCSRPRRAQPSGETALGRGGGAFRGL
ncbi:uncharacterized protein LOC144336544 [Macaca mulatta]